MAEATERTPIAILPGPLRFWRRLRERHFRLHRTIGKIDISTARLRIRAGSVPLG
jgi:hypothetical protein